MRATLPLTFFVLIFCSPSFAAIYLWVNEKGTPSYSQLPPPNKAKPFKQIETRASTPTTSAEQKTPGTHPDTKADDAAKLNRKQEKQRRQKIKDDKIETQKVCAGVKQNLALLERGGNPLFKDADGNYLRLDQATKDKKRQQNQQFLRDNCQ